MFKSNTRWRDKLEKAQEAKLVTMPPKMVPRFGKGKMLIPTPMLVDELIRSVRKAKLITTGQIRAKLARDFAADVTCPLTTGIFMRIAAEAAEEDFANGRKRITPYWRVVKDDGALNPKFPGGEVQQAKRLQAEGVATARRGNRLVVKDFEKYLAAKK